MWCLLTERHNICISASTFEAVVKIGTIDLASLPIASKAFLRDEPFFFFLFFLFYKAIIKLAKKSGDTSIHSKAHSRITIGDNLSLRLSQIRSLRDVRNRAELPDCSHPIRANH